MVKGQVFSTEIVISFSLFLLALLIFLLAFNNISYSYLEEQRDRRMEVALLGVADMAVLSPGDPQDWEITAGENANSFGFAISRNILSSKKLSAAKQLFSSNYTGMREKMGAGGYGLYIEVKDTKGTLLYDFGEPADEENESISTVTAERLAVLDDELVNVKVQVWRIRGEAI